MKKNIENLKLLIDKKQQIQIVAIIIMMVMGAFLETLGVSMIVPLVLLITEPGIMESNSIVKKICDLLDIQNEKSLLLFVIAALIMIFIIKGIFLFVEYHLQYKFVYNNRIRTQKQLLAIYLSKPYEFFLDTNFSEILQNITDNVAAAFTVLSNILGFFTEIIVSVCLVLTIFVIDPMMTILVGIILLLLMLFITKIIKPILEKEGKKQQIYGKQRSKWLLQAIHGIKEIKISRKEPYFMDRFEDTGRKCTDAERKNAVYAAIPRILIESFSISGMLFSIAILILAGNDIEKILPSISAFAMAAVRLMPSANRMLTYMNGVAYYEPALEKLAASFPLLINEKTDKKENLRQKECSLKHEIVLSGLSYHYPNAETNVLNDIEMRIPIGSSVGIVGTSGAGKTTVVDILLGLLKPQKGKVIADQMDVNEIYEDWLSHIGYIPQMIFMLDDTIRNNVAFGIPYEEIQDKRVWEALEEAQMADFVRSLPKQLDTEIGERGVRLSGGQRQRIGIARVLYSNSDLLIFDEATSALDNDTEAAMIESINHLHGKKTLIIIAHRLQTIEGCDMVYRVENGQIKRER